MKIFSKTFPLLLLFILFGCNQKTSETSEISAQNEREIIHYADGFNIVNHENHTEIIIKTPWPRADKNFIYALIQKDQTLENPEKFDGVIQIPVQKLIVTSTTHIPSLEMLNEVDALIGFPNPDFISSEAIRKRISQGNVSDVGQNEDLNTEIIIDLEPDALIGFSMDGSNPSFSILQKAKIPVLYNADWTETSPLGKAEWIKFFGALFDKQELANQIFKEIEEDYSEAKAIAKNAKTKPKVISGAMYNDVWYAPQGESWAAQFIADAHADYVWGDSKGVGSVSVNLEHALEKGHDADFWIGPAQYVDLESMKKANAVYAQFQAFKNKQIYTYNFKKGETGGSIYFELASNRPDLVLKDHIKILHPELLPDYELFFYDKLH